VSLNANCVIKYLCLILFTFYVYIKKLTSPPSLSLSVSPSHIHYRVTYTRKLTSKKYRILYSILEYDPLLDSSNMGMEDWAKIGKDIETYYRQFNAFVVLHGTDTMAYTASALSFMLEDLGKTVIVTGSQVCVCVSSLCVCLFIYNCLTVHVCIVC
jgi:hypothetical protein